MNPTHDKVAIREDLEEKIKMLSRYIWESRAEGQVVSDWLSQFSCHPDVEDDEQIHALFLLSHFLYFGQDELRFLLKSLYRDFIKAPMLRRIRTRNSHTRDEALIAKEFMCRQQTLRYLPVGNPAESGSHLLYYFRQENSIPKDLFIHTHEIFGRKYTGRRVEFTIRYPDVSHYIFIDDLCGSGTQAKAYCRDILRPLKKLSPNVEASYYVLFGTTQGLTAVRSLKEFDNVKAVFELDDTFKVLDAKSRIFSGEVGPFVREKIRTTCEKYGRGLFPMHPLGYKDGQLLIGFNHNTPDNTLPIFWGGDQADDGPWKPVFRRYHKVYGT